MSEPLLPLPAMAGYHRNAPADVVASTMAQLGGGFNHPGALAADGVCPTCGHEFVGHVVVSLYFGPIGNAGHADIPLAGLVLCDTKSCGCGSTWSMQGHERPPWPEDWFVDALRDEVQQ